MNRFLPSLKKFAAARMKGVGWGPLPPTLQRPRSNPTFKSPTTNLRGSSGKNLWIALLFLIAFGSSNLLKANSCNGNLVSRKVSDSGCAYNGSTCSIPLSAAPASHTRFENLSITKKFDHSKAMTRLWQIGHRPNERKSKSRNPAIAFPGQDACFQEQISAKTQRGNDLSY